jgi:D-psicose/D-tagatose/L-ribulose 3-epimerase
MHSAYATFPPRSDPSVGASPQLLARSAEVLRPIAAHAAAAGVRFGLEYLNRFECCLCNTASQTRALVDLVDHPACVGVYDTHHAHIEDPSQGAAVHALGSRLGHVQLSESHRGVLGSGQVQWPEVFAALRRCRYDGWLVVEAFSRQDPAFGAGLRIWRDLYAETAEVWRGGAAFVRERWVTAE